MNVASRLEQKREKQTEIAQSRMRACAGRNRTKNGQNRSDWVETERERARARAARAPTAPPARGRSPSARLRACAPAGARARASRSHATCVCAWLARPRRICGQERARTRPWRAGKRRARSPPVTARSCAARARAPWALARRARSGAVRTRAPLRLVGARARPPAEHLTHQGPENCFSPPNVMPRPGSDTWEAPTHVLRCWPQSPC